MKFTDIFINRPVLATVLSILLALLGLVAYQRLAVREFPKTDAYVISISTSYIGASANEMESYITQPIESAVASVDHVDYIESLSTTGLSQVLVHLKLNSDINVGVLDVQTKISSVYKNFPPNVSMPIVKKQDPGAMPMMIISFSDTHRSPEEITDYLTRNIIPQLNVITGVSSANIFGDRTFAMRLWLDPAKMAAHHVTALDIKNALNQQNLETQSGEIDRTYQIITVKANTALHTAAAFNNLIIKNIGDHPIRIEDIGHAELGAADTSVSFYVDGKKTVGVGIIAKSDANPLTVATLMQAKLKALENTLPDGMSTAIVRDSSTYIQQSIHEVEKTIIEACLFVVLVIFLFTASLRSSMIPIVTIPLSLVSITTFMVFMGYSINTLTLLAAVLAIGLIVDDAIVVLENVHRHIQQKGMSPFKAAIIGTREIRFAIISMTLTLAAVYSPLLFSGGLTGSLFREFAFVLAGIIIISGFLALTLSPMMCSKIMITMDKESTFQKKVDRYMNHLMRGYRRILQRIIHLRFIVISCMVVVVIMGLIVLVPLYLTSTLAPAEDEGVILGMAHAPTASNLQYTEKYTRQLGDIFKIVPESTRYLVINGFSSDQNNAFFVLGLKPWNEREKSASQLIAELYPKVNEVPGIKTMLFNPPALPGSSGIYPVEFVIKTNGSYEELSDIVDQFTNEIRKNPAIIQVQSNLYFNKPEVQVDIDRNKANALGITMQDIAKTLNITLGKPEISTFVVDGLSYYVIPELMPKDMNNPSKINNIYMKTQSSQQVPLSNLIHINQIVVPTELNHFQGQRAATLSMILKPNESTAQAIKYLSTLSKNILPSDMSYDFSGTTRLYLQEKQNMLQMFLLALLFIYLLLSAQFESFRYPFIVLMTVPLALTAALAALFFTNSSLNIYTEIALVTLIGLISKHGILIVEFARQLQESGESIHNAIMKAASIRLRPILMTTAAIVLGAIPLILSSGAGSNVRTQIGIVIISGMLLGTLLTLFLVPTFYIIFAKPHIKSKTTS